MSKHGKQKFDRADRDYYPTIDPAAVPPLMRHVEPGTRFIEPCAGAGDLKDMLTRAGLVCVEAYDIEPQRADVKKGDALHLHWKTAGGLFITNPPYVRDLMHGIIRHLSSQAPTWCLLEADWMHNQQAAQFAPIRRKVVTIGRLNWQRGTTLKSQENFAWYLFDARLAPARFTEFYGRGS